MGCPEDPDVIFPFGETTTGPMGSGGSTFAGTIDPTGLDDTSQDTGVATGEQTTGVDTTQGDTGSTTAPGTTEGSSSDGAMESSSDGAMESSSDGAMESSSDGMGGSTSTGMMGGSTSTGMMGGSTSTGMGGSTSTGMGGGSTTTGAACNDVPGNYEDCLTDAGLIDTTPCAAPGAVTCLTAGGPPATVGVCSVDGCLDECDCPAGPADGTAVVACSDVTGDPANLFCNLDCSGGATCPTDMVCFGGFICLWPQEGSEGEPYGDCFNNPADICGVEGVCLSDDPAAPTLGVCTTACPGGVGDCPAAPPGGAAPVACGDLTGEGDAECFLDCLGGAACPPGMSCLAGAEICVWQ